MKNVNVVLNQQQDKNEQIMKPFKTQENKTRKTTTIAYAQIMV